MIARAATAVALVAALAAAPMPAAASDWSAGWSSSGSSGWSGGWSGGWSIGGRLDVDAALADDDPAGRRDAATLRRARALLGWRGDRMRGVLLVDGADGDASVLDAWLRVRLRDAGGMRTAVRFGRLREPSGLDQLTGSDRLLFQERALASALAPGYNAGVVVSAWDRRRTLSLGLFDGALDDGLLDDGGDRALTARGVWRGWRPRPGRDELLHLGVSASLRAPQDDALRYRVRPESRLYRDPLLRTRSVRGVDRYASAGLEAAWRRGPLSVQGELLQARVPTAGGDARLSGGYLQAAWVLSGESRPYATSTATFGRLRPARGGAWEVGVRASRLDLDDPAVRGGRGESLGVAVNWTANRHARVMAQWLHSDFRHAGIRERDGLAQLRLQLTF